MPEAHAFKLLLKVRAKASTGRNFRAGTIPVRLFKAGEAGLTLRAHQAGTGRQATHITSAICRTVDKMKFGYLALTAALGLGLGVSAMTPAHAIGCFSGGAAGAVAGHMAHHHAVLGAAGGCIAGHEINKHRKEKLRQQQMQNAPMNQQ